ncbi:DUF2768 family protein [Paenibacillus agilis]|uniref:DUF2768 family protein n=1 Tax=Paenibacillus agilis TaxID=3020863 RepID=A0A559IZ21_9BACL|nr:DUF2768 family protein [Paenibacillus agilis]TVX92872.1 DUF2768 family protein [Paenibacillus agilis]
MDGLTKMWVSFIGIGLMALSAILVVFARSKTRGWIKGILTLVAFVILLLGMLYSFISIV